MEKQYLDIKGVKQVLEYTKPYSLLRTTAISMAPHYLHDQVLLSQLKITEGTVVNEITIPVTLTDIPKNIFVLINSAFIPDDIYGMPVFYSIVPEKTSLKIADSKSKIVVAYINNQGTTFLNDTDVIRLNIGSGGALRIYHNLTQYTCVTGFVTIRYFSIK